jgi:FkbM family methyltransferase
VVEHLKLLFRAWKYRLVDNPEEITYLLHIIQKGETVIDVGAHKGGYTYWMSKAVGKRGRVIAFEPQKKGATFLKELFITPNVQVEHQALSNRVGQQQLYIQPQAYNVSFEASLENKYENANVEVIETTTIDEYCHTQGLDPSFIKIDVEGHEVKVIEGAVEVLLKYEPILLVECEIRHTEREGQERIFRLLKDLHYSGFFYRKGKRFCIEEFNPEQDQHTERAGSRDYINNFYFEPKSRT